MLRSEVIGFVWCDFDITRLYGSLWMWLQLLQSFCFHIFMLWQAWPHGIIWFLYLVTMNGVVAAKSQGCFVNVIVTSLVPFAIKGIVIGFVKRFFGTIKLLSFLFLNFWCPEWLENQDKLGEGQSGHRRAIGQKPQGDFSISKSGQESIKGL